MVSSTSGEVTAAPSYGTGGIPHSTVLNPAAPDVYPGQEFTAALTRDLAGRQTAKTLTQGDPGQGDTRTGVRSTYDAAGRLASQTDQLGNTTTFSYTREGQVAQAVVETRDGKAVSRTAYAYSQDTGLLTSAAVTDAEGAVTARHMEYDRLNRLAGLWEGEGEAAREKTLISYGYDGEGRLVSAAYPDGKTVSRTYNAAGQLATAIDAAGADTEYAYNPDGSLKSAVQETADGQTASAAYTYDSLGRLAEAAYGNGTVLAVDYYDSGQPEKETLTGKNGTVLSETAYTYNSRGDLATRTDTRPPAAFTGSQAKAAGEGTSGTAVTTHTVHSYDAYGRLTSTALHNGTDAKGPLLRTTAYTANAAGDVTTVTVTGADGKKTATAHVTDPAGRLTALTTDGTTTAQSWDAAGNLLKGADGTAWTYTPDNKPATAVTADGTRTEYTYWADGSRRSSGTTAGDGTRKAVLFHYTLGGEIANDTHTSSDGGPSRTATYLTGPAGREARTLAGTPQTALYLHADRRGNTVLETGPAADIRTCRSYTDYGQETQPGGEPRTPATQAADPAANPFRFGGEYTNTETATHYAPARLYDPATGRFTTRDPHPVPLNKYQAFGANPVEYTDPTGNGKSRAHANRMAAKEKRAIQESDRAAREVQESRGEQARVELIDYQKSRWAHLSPSSITMNKYGWSTDGSVPQPAQALPYRGAVIPQRARGSQAVEAHGYIDVWFLGETNESNLNFTLKSLGGRESSPARQEFVGIGIKQDGVVRYFGRYDGENNLINEVWLKLSESGKKLAGSDWAERAYGVIDVTSAKGVCSSCQAGLLSLSKRLPGVLISARYPGDKVHRPTPELYSLTGWVNGYEGAAVVGKQASGPVWGFKIRNGRFVN
ncbi:RHS repeat-associated core domain-containing protein [Streptomyces sp. NRRL F-2664]|uniref:RHS repeat-associated core domain-containing protein n=1 Tax=Streptomyces sp. NRRL F-2664 TaxID=1463842 RepID=UPI0004C9B081|nr:RHS repeat-associated core domain-containing protein [Streptomyces sp. NRRL F-2664]